MNLSGGGVVATSDDKADAQKLLEWLATDGQEDVRRRQPRVPGQPRRRARRRHRRLRRRSRRCPSTPRPTAASTPTRSTCWRKSATSDPGRPRDVRVMRSPTAGPADPPLAVGGAGGRRGDRGAGRRGGRATGCAATGTAVAAVGPAEMVVTTLLLMTAVGVGTLVVGGGLAWLVTVGRFPLRDVSPGCSCCRWPCRRTSSGSSSCRPSTRPGRCSAGCATSSARAVAAAGAHAARRRAGHDA